METKRKRVAGFSWIPIALVLGAVAVAAIGVLVSRPPASLFVVGQRYDVIYSCVAHVGCYGESLTILELRRDGWMKVRDADTGDEWWANMASLLASRDHVAAAPVHERVQHGHQSREIVTR